MRYPHEIFLWYFLFIARRAGAAPWIFGSYNGDFMDGRASSSGVRNHSCRERVSVWIWAFSISCDRWLIIQWIGKDSVANKPDVTEKDSDCHCRARQQGHRSVPAAENSRSMHHGLMQQCNEYVVCLEELSSTLDYGSGAARLLSMPWCERIFSGQFFSLCYFHVP